MRIVVNIALTLIVGSALAAIVLKYSPAAWTPIQVMGLSLMVVAFVLWTLARFQLGNSLALTAQANQLVARGLYARIRNPIYFFVTCLIAGLILLLGRPVWFLVFAVIIPLQMWRAHEETHVLEMKFGEEYRKYRSTTWF